MHKTLVVGASTNPGRYSNTAIRRLVDNNIETTAFGIRGGTVSGVEIKNKLYDFQNIDTVTLYLSPKNQEAYYQQIVDLHPRRVIFNPGTENPEFYKILEDAGIQVVEACTLVLLATGQY
ncbi:MAG: CoA-binding protein [Muricauda sp.]|nr:MULTISPECIES: CoA-binding protein [unclassified Allomuricauda]MAU16894.1 CoA-binding protein [Allomuricauda sp.]|tara:strand:- start:7754 stop:8113 length:360 start_codon:yes stop_codon:yes gene_type:complete